MHCEKYGEFSLRRKRTLSEGEFRFGEKKQRERRNALRGHTFFSEKKSMEKLIGETPPNGGNG